MNRNAVEVSIANLEDPNKMRKVKLIIDPDAMFSIVSREILSSLGIKPRQERSFTLPSGQKTKRLVGGGPLHYRCRFWLRLCNLRGERRQAPSRIDCDGSIGSPI